MTLAGPDCYDARNRLALSTHRVLTTWETGLGATTIAAHSAPWTFARRRSFGPSSRNTSRPPRRSAARRSSSAIGLGVSSATVRSILAELEANGLLTHPHTSAGRIPTDAGYRFYVESIVEAVPLPAVEQLMIRHQFGQVEFASEHWFRLAATTLASVTRSAGLATPAKPRDAHIRRIDLVAINERMASLILVLREGAIKQALVTVDGDDAIDQPTLNAVAALLNERLVDMTARRAEARLAALDDDDRVEALARRVGERVVKVVREYDAAAIEEVFSDGLLNVMEAPGVRPERQAPARLQRPREPGLPRPARRQRRRSPAGSRSSSATRTSRSTCATSRSSSRRTAGPGRAIGVVGVLGPTRMSYSQAIGTVRFVSGLMNELVDHLYA